MFCECLPTSISILLMTIRSRLKKDFSCLCQDIGHIPDYTIYMIQEIE